MPRRKAGGSRNCAPIATDVDRGPQLREELAPLTFKKGFEGESDRAGSACLASVFSTFTAANATFALNAVECVRRLLVVIFAPDPRRESSPSSGRKSTHATVRICGASSHSGKSFKESSQREGFSHIVEWFPRARRNDMADAFPGMGRRYLIDFGTRKTQLEFHSRTSLTYNGVRKNGSLGASETVTITISPIRDLLFLVTWREFQQDDCRSPRGLSRSGDHHAHHST